MVATSVQERTNGTAPALSDEDRDQAAHSGWSDLVKEGVGARLTRDGAQWLLGDLACRVGKVYGQHELERYAAEIGVEAKTLANYRTVAKRIEKSRRRENLTFSHHAVIAAERLPEAVADELLLRAEEERWSVRRLQQEAQVTVIRQQSNGESTGRGVRTQSRKAWSHDLEEVSRFSNAFQTFGDAIDSGRLTATEVAALLDPAERASFRKRLEGTLCFLNSLAAACESMSAGPLEEEG